MVVLRYVCLVLLFYACMGSFIRRRRDEVITTTSLNTNSITDRIRVEVSSSGSTPGGIKTSSTSAGQDSKPSQTTSEPVTDESCNVPSENCCTKEVYVYSDEWFPVDMLGHSYEPPYEEERIPDPDYQTWQDYHERFYHMRPKYIDQFFEHYPIPFPVPDISSSTTQSQVYVSTTQLTTENPSKQTQSGSTDDRDSSTRISSTMIGGTHSNVGTKQTDTSSSWSLIQSSEVISSFSPTGSSEHTDGEGSDISFETSKITESVSPSFSSVSMGSSDSKTRSSRLLHTDSSKHTYQSTSQTAVRNSDSTTASASTQTGSREQTEESVSQSPTQSSKSITRTVTLPHSDSNERTKQLTTEASTYSSYRTLNESMFPYTGSSSKHTDQMPAGSFETTTGDKGFTHTETIRHTVSATDQIQRVTKSTELTTRTSSSSYVRSTEQATESSSHLTIRSSERTKKTSGSSIPVPSSSMSTHSSITVSKAKSSKSTKRQIESTKAEISDNSKGFTPQPQTKSTTVTERTREQTKSTRSAGVSQPATATEAPPEDDNSTIPIIIGVVGGLAGLGCVAALIGIIIKIKAKLSLPSLSSGASTGTTGAGQAPVSGANNSVAPASHESNLQNGRGQAPISGANNSVAPASSYEPNLQNVRVPEAPQPYGYQGSGGVGGPAEYNAPPAHVTPLENPPRPVPQFTGYTMAGQEPPLPGIPNAAGYVEEPVVAEAVYNLWL